MTGLSSFLLIEGRFRYPTAVVRYVPASSPKSHATFWRIRWTCLPFFAVTHSIISISASTFPRTLPDKLSMLICFLLY